MGDAMDVAVKPASGYVIALLSGVLSVHTVATARAALVELLDEADCVVADVSELELRQPGCVAVFSAAVEQAGGWPHARLALIGSAPRMLTHLSSRGGDTAVPIADGLDGALAMTDRPPSPPGASPTKPIHKKHLRRIEAISEKDPETAQFILDWLGILIDHDAVGRSELVETLSAFLENHGDYNDSARALGIHRSTGRYRIHRIRELTQLDLHDPHTRLNLQAATRVLARLPAAPPLPASP
ncbi:MAG: hypothetical protein QOI36_3 [Pseudonocardiales bacterium]|jgi:hypothetical protein|nr:hypothetical protein [Pseudonocardiales bacterium]